METNLFEALTGRFAGACEADARVAAAFVGGSRGAGTADEHADLDLYLILRDDTYDDFFAHRHTFMAALGDPVFLEDFNGFGFDMLLFIYADGVEGELVLARASGFEQIASGPFTALVDRDGVLPPQAFPPAPKPNEAEQREQLRWLVHWFWRDLSQLSRCLAREQPWSAYSHLEMMRHTCLRLARLQHDWTAALEGFYKIERILDPEDLASFQHTFCRADRAEIVAAVRSLIAIYERLAPPLAAAHGIIYPRELHKVVLRRFGAACGVPD